MLKDVGKVMVFGAFNFPSVNRDRTFDCVDVMREIAKTRELPYSNVRPTRPLTSVRIFPAQSSPSLYVARLRQLQQ
jgi:hypothetical protein